MAYKNREQKKLADKLYQQAHSEQHREADRRYSATHREQRRLHDKGRSAERVEYVRQWRIVHPGARRKEYEKRRYGMTPGKREEMWIAQDKKCAICGKEIALYGRGAAFIDHNHETGQVRALLCPGCNTLVGYLESSRFPLALNYIEKWREADYE